ncbi:type II toxin-antitoxin system VapC family toxin [Microbacterium sp.]|uniref:type II toxin-antitoxin system VapC family toxin n=1 Tax=Microbacterium sp. TaxID=51671 RepID=UPI003C72E5D9
MIAPDVNVLVQAYRAEAADHAQSARWLQQAVSSAEALALVDSVITGYVRVATNPRIYEIPTPPDVALAIVDELLAAPRVTRISPGPRHWRIFAELCRATGARGNLVSDAAHAAVAIEHGATWVTFDRDFARFPGLRTEFLAPGA